MKIAAAILGLFLLAPAIPAALPVPAATLDWVRVLGSTGFPNDQGRGLAIDASGSVYAVGTVGGTLAGNVSAGGEDAYVQKFDPDGNTIWLFQFGTGSTDNAFSVAAAASGFVYVYGRTTGNLSGLPNAGGFDCFLRKYSSSGVVQWTRLFGSSADDSSQGLALDASENIYVGGETAGTLPGQVSSGSQDAFLRKYDLNGTELWTRQFGTGGIDVGWAVAVDSAGNPHITGETWSAFPGFANGGQADGFLRKYDPNGNVIYTRQWGGPPRETGYSLVAAATDVYVAGVVHIYPLPGNRNGFLAKFDGAGNPVWTDIFDTTAQEDATAVCRDGSGLFVSGSTGGVFPGQASSGGVDAYVRRYDFAGAVLWTKQYGSAGDDTSGFQSAHFNGSVYQSGSTSGIWPGQVNSGGTDCFLARFSTSLAPGLVGYWPFDGDGSDQSGAARDLSITGGAGFAPGLLGQALDLHANNAQFAVRPGDDDAFDFGAGDFTLQCWVNLNSTNDLQLLMEKFSGQSGPGFTLYYTGAGSWELDVFDAVTGVGISSGAVGVTPGTWNHVVVRRSGTQFQFVVNGVPAGGAASSIVIADVPDPLLLGVRNSSGQFPLDGRLDEVAVWNRALGNAEIASLYNGGAGRPLATPYVWHVKPGGGGSATGADWTNAFASPQQALAVARPGDEIWVAAGTYLPTATTDRTIAFQLRRNVALYGGFAGTETLRSQRDWSANVTILSGDIGAPGNAADNSYHVVLGSIGATLDGFVVTRGNANGSGLFDNGGGLMSISCAPVISNCKFLGNNALYGGGALQSGAKPLFLNCLFSGNTAFLGGAVFNNLGSAPSLTNCTASRNTAGNAGFVYNSTPSTTILTNAIIFNNSAFEFIGEPSTITYTLTTGGPTAGTGNIGGNPLFVDDDGPDNVPGTLDDNFQLQPGSPCISAGTGVGAPPTDLLGLTRPQGTQVDLGAYEGNDPPGVNAGPDTTVVQGTALSGVLQITDTTSNSWTVTIDHGDLTSQSFPVAAAGPVAYSHIFGSSGLFTVQIGVTDNQGGTGSDSLVVTVVTQTQAVANLKTGVQASSLSATWKTTLSSILDQALRRINEGRPAMALTLIRSFANYIVRLMAAGSLSAAQGQPLLDQANALITSLTP